MFIGHLPAAYLFGRTVSKALRSPRLSAKAIVLAALFGGILPDFDLVYFYTIGGRQVVHHQYWSHIPYYWLLIYVVFSAVAFLLKNIRALKILSVVFSAIILHLLLDTITGQIHWLYPYSSTSITLVQVPSVHQWWVANFLLHWTFAVELLVVVLAVVVFFKRESA